MKTVWILNQYGPIEGENWRDYSYNQIGKYLAGECGYNVVWWTSNFAHHFKKYRAKGWKDIKVMDNYIIRLVPSTSYKKNFGIGRLLRDWSYAINAKRRFSKFEAPDIILTSMFPMTFGEPTYRFAKNNKIPYILNTMDIWPEFIEKNLGSWGKVAHHVFKPIYKKRKLFYSDASGLMALGKNYLEFAKNEAGLKKGCEKPYALVYNGSDLGKFYSLIMEGVPSEISERINKTNTEMVCIFAGTFGPSYDVEAMLQCAELCNKNKLRIKFVFCGSGPRINEVKEYASKYTNIIFLGSLKPSELIPLYSICDVGLCAYTNKSNVDMPDKFYDYCAAGLAVINSLTEEVATYVSDYEVGFNYTAGNAIEMYEYIKQLSEKKALLDKMKTNSKQLSEIFDSRVQNKKINELIEQILEN